MGKRQIVTVHKSIEFLVEMDQGDYRRGENGGWEKLMGNSWEPCYSEEDELEEAFKEFVADSAAPKS